MRRRAQCCSASASPPSPFPHLANHLPQFCPGLRHQLHRVVTRHVQLRRRSRHALAVAGTASTALPGRVRARTPALRGGRGVFHLALVIRRIGDGQAAALEIGFCSVARGADQPRVRVVWAALRYAVVLEPFADQQLRHFWDTPNCQRP